MTDDLIDTYGVDHSNFSARDEVAYQAARQAKENQLIQNYNNQGISDNYPQYGTNFWGNPDNKFTTILRTERTKPKKVMGSEG